MLRSVNRTMEHSSLIPAGYKPNYTALILCAVNALGLACLLWEAGLFY